MHTSEQEVTTVKKFSVEGPNEEGEFQINGMSGWYPADDTGWDDNAREAIKQHIESIPKPPTLLRLYRELGRAREYVGDIPADTHGAHENTALTEDESVELMRLLGLLQ